MGLFKSYSEKEVKRIKPIVAKINSFEEEISKLSDKELKGKTTSVGISLEIPSTTGNNTFSSSVVEEAISALTNLGYGRSEAGIVVGSVYKENNDVSVSDLIRLSLKEIGKKNG